MNKLILEELKKVKVAEVPSFSDDTLVIHIPKGTANPSSLPKTSTVVNEFEIGKTYRVSVDKSLVNPENKWYETIHGNWNGGVGLTEVNLDMKIIERFGKMVKVEAVGTDNPLYVWSGFLPQVNIKKKEELS